MEGQCDMLIQVRNIALTSARTSPATSDNAFFNTSNLDELLSPVTLTSPDEPDDKTRLNRSNHKY
jgi:hypothetical protein